MSAQSLTFERKLKAPVSAVYFAFTNHSGFFEWMCNGATVNATVGAPLLLTWNDGFYVTGEYTQLEENKAVGFTWLGRGEPAPTQVAVTMEEKDGTTSLKLVHGGLGSGEEWDKLAETFKSNWEAGLENLQSVVETGIDLRISRRPMLGITIAQLINDELAEKLGMDVSYGCQISGTVAGLGAEKVGLQMDDVVTQLGEVKIENFQSFAQAVAGKHAGDTLAVEYYRAGEKHTVDMILSARPMPEVQDDPKALAEQVKGIYDELMGELKTLFEGVSDEEASFNPEEGEWNAKQALAHLIIGEHGTLGWLTSLVYGNEQVNFAGNVTIQNNAIIAAAPTVPDLLAELGRIWTEHVSMIGALPETFTARKGGYVRMGQGLLQTAYHPRAHAAQIQAAIDAARSRQPA